MVVELTGKSTIGMDELSKGGVFADDAMVKSNAKVSSIKIKRRYLVMITLDRSNILLQIIQPVFI